MWFAFCPAGKLYSQSLCSERAGCFNFLSVKDLWNHLDPWHNEGPFLIWFTWPPPCFHDNFFPSSTPIISLSKFRINARLQYGSILSVTRFSIKNKSSIMEVLYMDMLDRPTFANPKLSIILDTAFIPLLCIVCMPRLMKLFFTTAVQI